MLIIREQERIGRARYVVSYCTGAKHRDGSDFYDVRIFRSAKAKDAFIRSLWAAEASKGDCRVLLS